MKMKSRSLVMLLLVSLLLSLSGCTKQKDSLTQDLASLETSGSSGDADEEKSSQLKKQLHVPEELQIEVLSDNSKRGYQVNCPVDVPIGTSLAVYRQKQLPFTKEEIIRRAENVFDSGEFFYLKPLDCYTLDELNEEYLSLEKIKEKKVKEKDYYYWLRSWDVEVYRREFKEEGVKHYREGDFTEGAGAACYEKIMIMEGEIEGETYHLLAFTSKGHNYFKLCRRSQGYRLCEPESYFGYNLKTYDLDDEISQETSADTTDDSEEPKTYRSLMNELEPTQTVRKQYGENICSYSEEEAGKLALQYAARLGDTDMTIAKTNWNFADPPVYFVSIENSEDYANLPKGYTFYLQRRYGNLSCNESNFWWREATDMSEEMARKVDPSGAVAEQENYRVEITDDGVIAIDSIEPWYEITETLSDSTSLMDFNDIQELATGYFEETIKGIKADEVVGKDITRIGEVALRYATVLYDGEYTLIPCWFFNQSDGTWGGMSTVMVINAIDGSKVFIRKMD